MIYHFGWNVVVLMKTGLSYRTLFDKGWVRSFDSEIVAQLVAFALAGAWLTLALSGRWRSAHDWVERLSRALGLAWFLTWAIWFVARTLAP
jgi:hypothetical protein